MEVQEYSSRGADKYSWVANEIRRRIATGQLAPGSQLPQRAEMEASFQVSKVTLQRAMNMLIEDGFIDATPSKGSFVAEKPPHLSRYALVFQGQPRVSDGWTKFWEAFANEAGRRERERLCTVPLFYGVDGVKESADFERLMREIQEHRLAGMIFVSNYLTQLDFSFLEDKNFPRVVIYNGEHPFGPAIKVSKKSFLLAALDYVASQGAKRVAIVRTGFETDPDYLLPALQERGLKTHPYWIQGIGLQSPENTRRAVHLLLHSGQSERPDALIIADDNLVEAGTSGILDAEMKVPEDLVVVAHANFPWKTPSRVDAKRLGYDVRQVLTTCIDSINAQRRGNSVPALTEIPALFEDEFENVHEFGN